MKSFKNNSLPAAALAFEASDRQVSPGLIRLRSAALSYCMVNG